MKYKQRQCGGFIFKYKKMKIFKELNKIGYKHYTENTIEELDNLPLDSEERIMEQSLAFRWFRETYDLMGLILPYLIIGNRWRYQITNRNNSSGLPFEEGFDTYEEAELACLRKLIEIVKNK